MDEQVSPVEAVTPPKPIVELTDDLTIIKIVLGDLIQTLRDGRKSRGRSVIITQLQLVRGMVHETQMEED
jgi:hypothetical protein